MNEETKQRASRLMFFLCDALDYNECCCRTICTLLGYPDIEMLKKDADALCEFIRRS